MKKKGNIMLVISLLLSLFIAVFASIFVFNDIKWLSYILKKGGSLKDYFTIYVLFNWIAFFLSLAICVILLIVLCSLNKADITELSKSSIGVLKAKLAASKERKRQAKIIKAKETLEELSKKDN